MVAVSVIVPVHNSKKYIEECIDSIIRQTLKNIEILCIDSGSDGTTDILYNYRDNDSRVSVIEDENSSYGYKINLGIQKAKGEYITIVESDDYIAENMLEKLYQVARQSRLDFVKANYDGFIDTNTGRLFSRWNRAKENDYNRIIDLKQEKNLLPSVAYNICSGIYNTQFLRKNKILFHESAGASYQDIGFAGLTAMLGKRIYFVKDGFYKYRLDNEGSSTSSDRKYKCVPREFEWLWDRMKELECNTEVNIVFFNMLKMNAYFWNYRRLSESYKQKLLEETPRDSLRDFDERVIGCEMPYKQYVLNIYDGDAATIEKEELYERNNKELYTKLLSIFRNYDSIVIVCAGNYGQSVYTLMKLANSSAGVTICDNYMQGKEFAFSGTEIISVEEAVTRNKEDYFIIANGKNGDKLKEQLLNLGVQDKKIFICNSIAMGLGLFEDFNKYS